MFLLSSQAPSALPSYCHQAGPTSPVWAAAVQALVKAENTPATEQALDALLEEMSSSLPPEQLLEVLPPGDQFQHYLATARKLSQAAKMQNLIVTTGHKLLTSLTL